jgi:hypothetical protein
LCCKNTRPNRLSEGPGMKDRAIQRQDLGFIAEYGDCHPRFFYPTVNRFPFPPPFFFFLFPLDISRRPPAAIKSRTPFRVFPRSIILGSASGRKGIRAQRSSPNQDQLPRVESDSKDRRITRPSPPPRTGLRAVHWL